MLNKKKGVMMLLGHFHRPRTDKQMSGGRGLSAKYSE